MPPPALTTRVALWAQAHPWGTAGVLTALTGLASSALLLAWHVEWSTVFLAGVLMTLVHVPEGVMLGAAACLLVVALRRRRLDVAGTAWMAIAVALPIVWLLPSALWAAYGPFGAAVSWTSPETTRTVGFASARAVGFAAVLLVVLRAIPRRGHGRTLGAPPMWTVLIAALGSVAVVAVHQTLQDSNGIRMVAAVGGTLLVAFWLGVWVRTARSGWFSLAGWGGAFALVYLLTEIQLREVIGDRSVAASLYDSLRMFAAFFDVWGRLLGLVLFAPLVRALDRVTLIPADHPVHDGRNRGVTRRAGPDRTDA